MLRPEFKMADISLLPRECFEDSEDDKENGDNSIEDCRNGSWSGGSGDCDSASFHQDEDSLSPSARMDKYALSENILYRQMVPSILLEIFRDASPESLSADIPALMDTLSRVADDNETTIRTDLVQRIPHLAAACFEYSSRCPALANVNVDHLLPLVVRYLGDADSQVRKSTYATLLAIMEQALVPKKAVEMQVCPKVLQFSHAENLMDYQTGAVTLMSKMVPLLGRETTERLFLRRFAELCSNPMFYIRKICASSFGEFCAVVGTEAYENVLLPCFKELCADDVWGVRKACAEVIMSVSCACSPSSRKKTLAAAFARLLQDQSRWVRMSAFQTLGPFISTFADPSIIGLTYNHLGELVLINPEGTEFRINSPAFTDVNLKAAADFKQLFFQAQEGIVKDTKFGYVSKYDLQEMRFERYQEDLQRNKVDNTLENSIENTLNNSQENIKENATENTIENNTEHSLDNKIDKELEKSTDLTKNDVENSSNSSEYNLNQDEFLNLVVYDTANSQNKILSPKSTHNNRIKHSAMVGSKNVKKNVDQAKIDYDIWVECGLMCDMDINAAQKNNEDGKDKSTKTEDEDLNKYGAHQYWYISPEMPLDQDILDSCIPTKEKNKDNLVSDTFLNKLDVLSFNNSCNNTLDDTRNEENVWSDDTSDDTDSMKTNVPFGNIGKQKKDLKNTQEIVPQMLIEHFISMTNTELAGNTDNDMAYHCAFSLPAVALTLGRSNWHLLKRTCETLAADMQYKVRKTVASSIHELALILGQDLAGEHLVPIFDGFIKDLDEVRIGVLKHLAHFLKLIGPEKRNHYLPCLAEFLQTDNEWNWRFREELANQLLIAVPLFQAADASKHIVMLAQELLCDKVFAVRRVALALVTELVRHMSGDPNLTTWLLIKLAEEFAHSKRWVRRQAFALLCSCLIDSGALPPEKFATEVMPHLLDLSWDPVPNVRLAVSRTIARNIMVHEYFMKEQQESLQTVLRRMQSDKDRDVRHYALISYN